MRVVERNGVRRALRSSARARAAGVVLAVAATRLPLLGTAPAHAAVTTSSFAAAADARVEKASPTANYGTATSLTTDASPVVETYVRFAPSGLAGTVRKAVLRLSASNGSVDGPAVYATTST